MRQTPAWKKALRAAFPYTIPIFSGFWFLGLTYGIYMNVSHFEFWYPMLMSMAIFAGSVEFVTVAMLLGEFNPLQAFILGFMINARHLFYGISMLDKYKGMGWKKFFLIYWLCDETFSINYTANIPHNVDKGWFMLWVSILNYLYWVSGATIGGIFGSYINFDTTGLDFALTAMFVVIFMEQWLKDRQHFSAPAGIALSMLSVKIFGADNFVVPAMIGIVVVLSLLRRTLEKGGHL